MSRKYIPIFKSVGNTWQMRSSRYGIEYGGTNANYYWNINLNACASPENCLANCTCYAYGRILEANCPAPVSYISDAMGWHNYLTNGWTYVPYSFDAVEVGDILEWNWYNPDRQEQENHVAVVEKIENGQIYISESYYTARNTSQSLAYISQWMINNHPDRFFHYGTMYSAYGDVPDLILKNPVNFTETELLGFIPRKTATKRRIRYV